MKPLTLEETKLKEEMKQRCLIKGQYADKNAKNKFKMLCHLEDFEIQYWELLEENKQLKDNWNYIKKMLKEARQEKFNINGYCGTCTDVDIDFLLNKMQELEQGSDSNE